MASLYVSVSRDGCDVTDAPDAPTYSGANSVSCVQGDVGTVLGGRRHEKQRQRAALQRAAARLAAAHAAQ